MKRLQKVLIFVALMVCSVYGIVFMHAANMQGTTKDTDHTVLVSGQVNYTKATELLNLINAFRVENGRSALAMDYYLQEYAIERAYECHATNSHNRPNAVTDGITSSFIRAYEAEYGVTVASGTWSGGENIGSNSSAQGMFTDWKGSVGHCGTMNDASWKSVGIGCVTINGVTEWVFVPNTLAATHHNVPTSGVTNETRRELVLSEKALKYFIYGANIEVGETRNSGCYIRMPSSNDSGITLTLPQAGVYFSSTSDKIHVDSASGTVTGLHAGTFDITMTVNGVSFTNQYECLPQTFENVTISMDKQSYDYTGTTICPKPTLYDTKRRYTLVEGTDYTLSYRNNTNAGTGYVDYVGIGDYGSRSSGGSMSFTIISTNPKPVVKNISSCTIAAIADCYADGSAQKPKVTITDGNYSLTENIDYTLNYSNNVHAGTGKVTITGINKYAGTVVKTFTVRSQNTGTGETTDIAGEPVITLSGYTFTYTGQAVKPKVAMKFRGFEMAEGSCYTVEYLNNVNPGTATVRVKGTGAFSGHKDLTFTIVKKSSSSTVNNKPANNKPANSNTPANGNTATNTVKKAFSIKLGFTSKTYSGKALKPKVKVSYGGKKLSAKNYKVSYKNNKNSGIAAVIVTGKGSYKGVSGRAYFTIVPKKVSQKTPAAKKGALTVKWKKDASAGGYQIQVSTRKNFRGAKTYTTGKKSSYTVRKLQRKTKYYVRIRAYKKSGGTTIWGAWSSTKNKKTK